MVASHDLCQDLGVSPEELDKHRATNPTLDKLVADYQDVDQRTVNAEVQSPSLVSDDEIRGLKEQRRVIKDRIMQQLKYPEAGD